MRAMTPAVEAYCPEHAEAPALETCARCGRFLCTACTVRRQGGVYCVECVNRLQLPEDGPAPSGPDESASLLSFYTVLLGGLSFCIPLLGLIAVPMGAWELARIRAGSTPVGGRFMARTGIVLGSLSVALYLVLLSFAFDLWS